jgi:ribose 5-phosphate isomerase A
MTQPAQDTILDAIARRALDFVTDRTVVGLGSGRAAAAFVRALGERVRQGLQVRGVPTSEGTADIARASGVELTSLDEVDSLALTVDGADEVDPHLDLIKGYGHALVREKIVAAASQRVVILVGSEKLVSVLGSRGIVPVEVVPFAASFCQRQLAALGCQPKLRLSEGRPKESDNRNYIIDCGVAPLAHPRQFDDAVRAKPGVVGTGLFLGVADTVLVGDGDTVKEMTRGG